MTVLTKITGRRPSDLSRTSKAMSRCDLVDLQREKTHLRPVVKVTRLRILAAVRDRELACFAGGPLPCVERCRREELSKSARERAWTAAARSDAVLSIAVMDEAAKSAWCCANGLFPLPLSSLAARRHLSATQALDQRWTSAQRPVPARCKPSRTGGAPVCPAARLPVCPAARHDGQDKAILAERRDLYIPVRNLNPARWSGATRDCSPAGPVTVNPKRDSAVAAHLDSINSQPLAA